MLYFSVSGSRFVDWFLLEQRRLRIATDTTEEQLSDAYSRSVRVSSTELCVSSHVQGQSLV